MYICTCKAQGLHVSGPSSAVEKSRSQHGHVSPKRGQRHAPARRKRRKSKQQCLCVPVGQKGSGRPTVGLSGVSCRSAVPAEQSGCGPQRPPPPRRRRPPPSWARQAPASNSWCVPGQRCSCDAMLPAAPANHAAPAPANRDQWEADIPPPDPPCPPPDVLLQDCPLRQALRPPLERLPLRSQGREGAAPRPGAPLLQGVPRLEAQRGVPRGRHLPLCTQPV